MPADGARQVDVVDILGDVRIEDRVRTADAADEEDLRRRRDAGTLDGDARHLAGQVARVDDVLLSDLLRADHTDGDGRLLQAGLLPRRGDDDVDAVRQRVGAASSACAMPQGRTASAVAMRWMCKARCRAADRIIILGPQYVTWRLRAIMMVRFNEE